MRHLYDFGISQEDPLTELKVLDIQQNDNVLCVSSGGEVPLSLLCLRPGVKITAVDIADTQLMLCRLKMQAALLLPFPLNGQFLGYDLLGAARRRSLYLKTIHSSLQKDDQEFWMQHITAIEDGVIHYGRFERYIKRLRKLAVLLIGKKNIHALLNCNNVEEQQFVFDKTIGKRKAVKYLFRIAFHPAIYKNRGLNSKGLVHAHTKTGQLFFNKFRSFCTATPAINNYFLQYFLTGTCAAHEGFPEYLQEENRLLLQANKANLVLKLSSLQDALKSHPAGTFNKIHFSNIGDWMSSDEFTMVKDTLCSSGNDETRCCYRFLQKNHLDTSHLFNNLFDITAVNVEETDRFPFYSILSIHGHGKV